MIASIAESTIAESRAALASTVSSALSAWRDATRIPVATAVMSASSTPPSSHGAWPPCTNAATLRASSASRQAPTRATGRRGRPRARFSAIRLTKVKASGPCRRIVRGDMNYLASELVIDPVLLRTHDVSGPRYTSYPTADRFVEAFGEATLRQWLGRRNIGGISQPLSLYVHLPFCDTLCYYCGCNKVVTRDHGRSAKYIKYLQSELALLKPLLERDRRIVQLHWGG